MTDEGQNSELEALFDSASKDARDMMSEKRTFTKVSISTKRASRFAYYSADRAHCIAKDDYGRVLEDLRKCADWVNELYLFCGNESFEDIQTSHIKWVW